MLSGTLKLNSPSIPNSTFIHYIWIKLIWLEMFFIVALCPRINAWMGTWSLPRTEPHRQNQLDALLLNTILWPYVSVSPRGHKSGEVSRLVLIHPLIGVHDEAWLLAKRPDDAGTLHRLIQMCVDGRATHRLQTTQLARRGHVETLRGWNVR